MRLQHYQMKKDKRTNNDLQNIAQKSKDQEKQTPLKTGVNSGAPELPNMAPPISHT